MDELDELQVTAYRGRGLLARLAGRWRRPPVSAEAGTSRRSFLRSTGGYATGVAAIVGVPAAVLLETDAQAAAAAKSVANPTTPVPSGPVMAYVHDARKGTVVIMSGTSERTVQDHALVQKLLHAPKKPRRKRALTTNKNGG
ncbi:hypothetical protein NBH00_22010 [Paraconexibacter antarcticus]|uniref:Twin-arginine translocation signal domain-containing protein n=1 Tax=Paraconexibacter antarcticus TaxID=2949664 RepID=A0ABY5DTF2_9ACTN|nr:hypothetical protein [Paraconexibacter antarcticus]UTI64002.1 hypothetical protein NBH00_22010 [Paraconexibacter antarcticus]